jgi:hypothetical protein
LVVVDERLYFHTGATSEVPENSQEKTTKIKARAIIAEITNMFNLRDSAASLLLLSFLPSIFLVHSSPRQEIRVFPICQIDQGKVMVSGLKRINNNITTNSATIKMNGQFVSSSPIAVESPRQEISLLPRQEIRFFRTPFRKNEWTGRDLNPSHASKS